MEDELRKRMTDCVYFLASPLTCKKGIECEFRHNEIARLNPRECWYWLAGNCANPTCGFRHPPLEGQPENSTEPASLPLQAAVPVSKSSIPCYFHFSGFCNKGDNCPFLHGSNSITSGQFSKAASTVTNVHLSENKAPASIEGVAPSVKPSFNQLEITTKARNGIQFQSKVESQPSASNNILQQSPSSQTSFPECDEPIVKSELLHPAETIDAPLVVDGSSPCGELSSEDRFDGHREPEERWESSPGFDVLVDDGSEKLGYENDPEYAHNRDGMLLPEHLLQYDYEDPVGYSPHEYPESGTLYEHGMYGSYENLGEDHSSELIRRRITKRSRERILSPMVHSKRRLLSKEIDISDRNGSDLRNHLRSRRRTVSASHSRRHNSSHLRARSQDRRERRHNRRPVQERLATDFRGDIIGRHSEDDGSWQDGSRQSHPRYTQSRLQEREKRRQVRPEFISSELSRGKADSQDSRLTQESSTAFTGPKTLAQIKEEKLQAKENRDSFGSTAGNTMLQTFEGPRPLSEILKKKRKSTSNDSGSSERGTTFKLI